MLKPEYRDIKELNKLEGNPRIIKDKQFKQLCESIAANGDYFEARPVILSDRTGKLVIIAGNQRYEAAQHLGIKSIPTVLIPDLTEEREREIIIRDNVSNGEWDFEILANEWDTDDLLNWGVEIPDITVELDPAEAKEDDFEIPGTIKTDIVLGDLIEIGQHRLVCGDSREADVLQKLFGETNADLIVTDPPYNVDYSDKTEMLNKADKGNRIQTPISNDKMSDGDFGQFLLDAFITATSFLKPGGAVYVWHTDNEGLNFRHAFVDSGLTLSTCLIWVKNVLVLGRLDYQKKHESCLYGWKPGAAHYFTDDRRNTTVIDDQADLKKLSKAEMLAMLEEVFSDKVQTTVLRYDKPQRNAEHPTMKPVPLIGHLIGNSSKKGEVVADTFGGSGTTMVASHQLGRRAYLCELDPKYCQVIVNRMHRLDPALEIKRNGTIWNTEH